MSRYHADSLFASEPAQDKPCTDIIRVAFESGADAEFDYLVPDELWPVEAGRRVEAPFGRTNKLQVGFCVESDVPFEDSFSGRGGGRRLKKVARAVDESRLVDTGLMSLARWISSYYVCPLGQVLAAMVPSAVKKGIGVKKERLVHLSEDSKEVLEQLRGKKQKQIVSILQQRKALDADRALLVQVLLEEIGCTNAPVKKIG